MKLVVMVVDHPSELKRELEQWWLSCIVGYSIWGLDCFNGLVVMGVNSPSVLKGSFGYDQLSHLVEYSI